MQGAGGVGGLLYLTINDSVYIPFYDNNGNITRYLDATGNTVAQYTYDAFGNTISQSGSLANIIRHRFSTKYIDSETGLYYYGYRLATASTTPSSCAGSPATPSGKKEGKIFMPSA